MSSQRVKKELYETAMTGEKALTSLMYVQMTLYAAKSQKTYARVRSEGRARMRHTGLHMNQYLRAAGKDLESFRNRLKETHLPEELQSKAETFLVQTVHVLDVTEKKQMYRRELIGMEEKVKETAEQIEELLKSMRELHLPALPPAKPSSLSPVPASALHCGSSPEGNGILRYPAEFRDI